LPLIIPRTAIGQISKQRIYQSLTTSQGTIHQPLWNLGWLLIASLELGQDPIDEIPVTIE